MHDFLVWLDDDSSPQRAKACAAGFVFVLAIVGALFGLPFGNPGLGASIGFFVGIVVGIVIVHSAVGTTARQQGITRLERMRRSTGLTPDEPN